MTVTTQVLDQVEQDTREIGHEIFAHLKMTSPSILSRDGWDARMLEWCMRDESLKVGVFRFIDVLPTLRTSEQVIHHLWEYLTPHEEALPAAVRWGLRIAGRHRFGHRPLASAVQRNAVRLARRFIAGATIEEALTVINELRQRHTAFTLDILGEATLSEREAEAYTQRLLTLMETLATHAASWTPNDLLDRDHRGQLPSLNVSLKLSSLYSQFTPLDQEGSRTIVKARLRSILRRAREVGAFVTVDMEQYELKDLTLHIFKDLLDEEEFRNFEDVGIVLQAYLKDAERDLRDLLSWIGRRRTSIGLRLVKGAYWDYEGVIAQQHGWPIPVFTEKWETDVNFERLSLLALQHHDLVRPAIGSHNIRSIAHALACARRLGAPEKALEFQMLYGMGDPVKDALVALGQRVRVYTPFGELIPGMGYLIRRLLENTSNESFLRLSFTEDRSPEELLKPPEPVSPDGGHAPRPRVGSPAEPPPFRNQPELDFAGEEPRNSMQAALAFVRGRFGRLYPLIIGGEEVEMTRELISRNPSCPEETVGRSSRADLSAAEQALAAAKSAFPRWASTSPRARAELLFHAATIMRRQRVELAAWEVFEVGKPWAEADADVAEAIDYLEYYGREMIRLGEARRLGDTPGEVNEYGYQPRGVAVIIAPWNFPLAILTGMTAAALVAGNTAIMKPAEQSPITASHLMAIFREAGFPPGVVNYLPGLGEEVGEHLVMSPSTDLVAFTGSRGVGLRIYELAAKVGQGQRGPKRVIAEMGGKNAIIVDEDADLDEAIRGVVSSAFGYAGQKCSACSRAIVVGSAYDAFLARLAEAAASLKVGPAEDPGTVVGPLIDEEAHRKVRGYIERGRGEARLLLETDVSHLAGGYFVGPTVFADVSPLAAIAQEEIFGPVLAVIRAAEFEEALAVANATEYALTGGLYSRSPAHIARAKEAFRVGNLYINRPITGAIVGRQPFGGFKMSGIGSKAGGPDYLLQFVEPRTITENTLRRGFAPSDVDV
jgi:RHH-type transcriptional regulator, proline utilization regulon repressor / proline dehydrogenase / delta 1-pyrroline-5-carboxylate dehydrogenase